jgi:hypothetical protein
LEALEVTAASINCEEDMALFIRREKEAMMTMGSGEEDAPQKYAKALSILEWDYQKR